MTSTFGAHLAVSAAEAGHRTALVFEDRTWTYAELGWRGCPSARTTPRSSPPRWRMSPYWAGFRSTPGRGAAR